MAYREANDFLFGEETEAIIQVGLLIHKKLGFGFLEIIYKDALELDFSRNEIPFTREKMYQVEYNGAVLKHYFVADFIAFDEIILEIKAKQAITPDDIAQTINYLKCSGCRVALILNFGKNKLEIKRLML